MMRERGTAPGHGRRLLRADVGEDEVAGQRRRGVVPVFGTEAEQDEAAARLAIVLHEPRPGAFDRLLARRRVGDLHRARALAPEQPSRRRLAGGERGFVRRDGDVVGKDADAELRLVGVAEEARLDAHREEEDRDAVVESVDPPPRIADRRTQPFA